MAGGEVAKRQPRAKGDAGTRVGAGHQRIHVVSHRVQPRNGVAFSVDDLGIGGGDQTSRSPQIAGIEFDGIERRAEQGSVAGVRMTARIAHRPVIAVAAFGKLTVHTLRGVTIVAGDRLAQGVGIQPKLLRKLRTTIDDAMNNAGLPLIGVIPEDAQVMLCANRGIPLTSQGRKGAAMACRNIAWRLMGRRIPIMRIR